MASLIDGLQAWYDALSGQELAWIIIGFVAQFMFMMRFVMQCEPSKCYGVFGVRTNVGKTQWSQLPQLSSQN